MSTAELGALSSPATKVCEVGRIRSVFPFASFYTEALLVRMASLLGLVKHSSLLMLVRLLIL